jgi:LemA protein
MLTQTLRQLFALAEAYPDLKANQNFLDLQEQLSEIEEQIQFARRYYNGAARDMNILVQSFPSNVIARSFSFIEADYFEIELATEREAPQVQF